MPWTAACILRLVFFALRHNLIEVHQVSIASRWQRPTIYGATLLVENPRAVVDGDLQPRS